MSYIHQRLAMYIYEKKADRFFNFYLPDSMDILLCESSSPARMVILPLGTYKTILEKILIKSKKALKNQGFSQGIFFVTLLWSTREDSNLQSIESESIALAIMLRADM